MKTNKGFIACSPVNRDFKPELKTSGGFGLMEQRTELVELKVILDSESDYNAGDSIYVNGARLDVSSWVKALLVLDKLSLILVPESEVLITKRGEKDDSVCTQK